MGKKRKSMTKEYYMTYWMTRLTDIVSNFMIWKGLPEEINPSAMEKQIMLGAYGIFFKETELGKYFSLGGALRGVDVYGYPTTAKPIPRGIDGQEIKDISFRFPEYTNHKDCVIIYANRTRTSALTYISEYADKLSDIDVAIKMNTRSLKHPFLVRSTEQAKESFETLMHQYDEDYYIIQADKSLTLQDAIAPMRFSVDPMELLNIQKQKENILNEFYAVFGVTTGVEKRERMIAGEISALMQQSEINKSMWLSTRKEACKEINRIFGLNVSVDYNKYKVEDSTDSEQKEEQNDQ